MDVPIYRKPPVEVKAVFIGHEGSLGYKRGQMYDLLIQENCILRPSACPYGSIELFLRNWTLVHTKEG